MPTKEEKASEKEPDAPENVSVFDFLYQDVRRIGSFLSQFDDAGHLQQIVQGEAASKGGKRGWKASAGGGLPVGQANLSYERGPTETGQESSERIYDPLWANARTLLDYLEEQGMITRDIGKARIGQFVLVSGALSVMNLGLLRSAWDVPEIKEVIRAGENSPDQEPMGNRQERRAQGRHKHHNKTVSTDPIDVAFAFLKLLPHSVQARITDKAEIFCNLVAEGLTVSADDLLLKNGVKLEGTWNALGILDAFPDNLSSQTPLPAEYDVDKGGLIGALLENIVPVTRLMLGRPPSAYGITPLLIFREVSG